MLVNRSHSVQRDATATDDRGHFELAAEGGDVLSQHRELVIGGALELRESALCEPGLFGNGRLRLAGDAPELAKAHPQLVVARLVERRRLRQIVHQRVERLGGDPYVAFGPLDRAVIDQDVAEDPLVDERAERLPLDVLGQIGNPIGPNKKFESKPIVVQRFSGKDFHHGTPPFQGLRAGIYWFSSSHAAETVAGFFASHSNAWRTGRAGRVLV